MGGKELTISDIAVRIIKYQTNRLRKCTNSIGEKRFKGGNLLVTGAPNKVDILQT